MSTAPLSLRNPLVSSADIRSRMAQSFKQVLRAWRRANRIRAAQMHLRDLDDYLLRDIGLSRGELYDAVRGKRR
jgi:uncharacterized protein YjiS (DUF1127 family)